MRRLPPRSTRTDTLFPYTTLFRSDDDVPRIWVDADACPGVIKDILFRAAERTRVRVTLVANQWLRTPPSRFIEAIQVPGGFDVADSAIVERVRAGDLVVTRSEEHTSELQSLMRISYAVFCLKKKTIQYYAYTTITQQH